MSDQRKGRECRENFDLKKCAHPKVNRGRASTWPEERIVHPRAYPGLEIWVPLDGYKKNVGGIDFVMRDWPSADGTPRRVDCWHLPGYDPSTMTIRAFTNEQGRLRLGREFTEDEMQTASNMVARNVANGLLLGDDSNSNDPLEPWTVPRIDQIAELDAKAIGEALFRETLGVLDTATTRNAGWSGAVGFNLLGGPNPFETWRLMSAGDPGSELNGRHQLAQPNSLDDFKNILFAVHAYGEALQAGFVAGGLDFLQALAEGAVAVASEGTGPATTPARDALVAQWNVMMSSGNVLGVVQDVAGAGADTLKGLGGDDYLQGDAGNGTLERGDGSDNAGRLGTPGFNFDRIKLHASNDANFNTGVCA